MRRTAPMPKTYYIRKVFHRLVYRIFPSMRPVRRAGIKLPATLEIGRVCATKEEPEIHRLNGKLHHLTGPAKTTLCPDGSKIEEYYFHGLRHRIDAPAIIKTEADGTVREEFWLSDKRHADIEPAVIIKRPDRTQRLEYWQNMVLHREGRPAIIEYNGEGLAVHEEYWKNGKLLYVDANVVKENTIEVSEVDSGDFIQPRVRLAKLSDGTIQETHHLNGRLHRENAPARITVTPNGTRYEEYWTHGEPAKTSQAALVALGQSRQR